MSTEYEQAAQSAHAALNKIREAATRISPAAKRELLRRLKELNTRMDAAQQVDRWARTQHTNGHREAAPGEDGEETIPAPRAEHKDRTGGRRGSGVWHHGVELERQD